MRWSKLWRAFGRMRCSIRQGMALYDASDASLSYKDIICKTVAVIEECQGDEFFSDRFNKRLLYSRGSMQETALKQIAAKVACGHLRHVIAQLNVSRSSLGWRWDL